MNSFRSGWMFLSVVGSVVISSAVFGADRTGMSDREKYFTIESVQIVDEGTVSIEGESLLTGRIRPLDPIDDANIILDKIINMGKKVWAIVEMGRPVVNYKTNIASAVPEGLSRWEQLTSWQTPVARMYRAVYRNAYGAKVVEFSYRVIYTYGGSLAGRGRYLTQVTVVPGNLNVSWGFTFNADVSIPNVVNTGTSADPVAGLEVLVHWKVNSVMKHSESTASYFIKGDGTFVDMTNGSAL